MLPYKTILEAEEALGRNLTSAESLWFCYSADKADFLLYAHNIVFLFLVYTLAPLPVTLLEFACPTHIRRFKLQPKTRQSAAAVLRCYKAVVRSFILAVVPLQVLSFPVVQWIGIRVGLPLPSTWEMAAKLGIYFVVEDFLNYWLHRALHSKWGYDKIHRVHHEFTAPVAYAAPYAHWSEILILGLPSFIGPAIVPCHLVTFCLWFVLRQIEAIETHCGYDFPHSPTKYIPFYGGAEYHDYHHRVGGQSHCNFASVFSYCDFIYGTNKSYRYRKSLLVKVLSFPVAKWVGIQFGLPLPSKWEIAAKLGIYIVVEDYFSYWLHRALHSKWAYDKIHRMHHEFIAPVAYASLYAHWSEILLFGLPSFIGPAIVPCHIVTFCLWFVLRHLEAIETHCGYDFPHSPTKYIPFYGGAEYHDYHHHVGGRKYNFASVFSYCDFIYGTNKSYTYRKSLLVKMRTEYEGKGNE